MDKEAKEKTEKALQKLYSSEQLDQMLSLSQPKRWGIVATLICLLIVLILWSFFGRIPTQVIGRGVVLGAKGTFTIESKATGIVSEIFVQRGQILAIDTPIAAIYNSEIKGLVTAIEKTLLKISNIKSEQDVLKRAQLYAGDSKEASEEYKSKLIVNEIQLNEAESSLATIFSNLEKISPLPPEQFLRLEQKIIKSKAPISKETLENELVTVVNPEKGKVLEILVNKGDVLEPKTPLVWMEYPSEKEPLFFSYFPVQDGNKIQPGMQVTIEPTAVYIQEYGSIIGYVKEVSPFAISEQMLMSTLGNKQLVKYLTEDLSSVIQVIIEGKRDPTTASGFAWTSQKGPPFKIPTGSVCLVKVLTEEQPPISFLIPLWKIKPL